MQDSSFIVIIQSSSLRRRRFFNAFLAALSESSSVPQPSRRSLPSSGGSQRRDILSGEIEGFAIHRAGRSVPLRRAKARDVHDPFVLSQVTRRTVQLLRNGNDGKITARGTELKALATATEPEVYALAFPKWRVVRRSSPNGKVYRIDRRAARARSSTIRSSIHLGSRFHARRRPSSQPSRGQADARQPAGAGRSG